MGGGLRMEGQRWGRGGPSSACTSPRLLRPFPPRGCPEGTCQCPSSTLASPISVFFLGSPACDTPLRLPPVGPPLWYPAEPPGRLVKAHLWSPVQSFRLSQWGPENLHSSVFPGAADGAGVGTAPGEPWRSSSGDPTPGRGCPTFPRTGLLRNGRGSLPMDAPGWAGAPRCHGGVTTLRGRWR